MYESIDIKKDNIKISNMENGNRLPENNMEIYMCCCGCFIFLFSIGLIGCVITYYVFAIMSLVQDYHFMKECPNIHIWQYVLTSLIINFLITPKGKIEDRNKMTLYIIQIIVNIGMSIWGLIELTKYTHCDSIKTSLLWTITIITVIANLINILLYIIMIVVKVISK